MSNTHIQLSFSHTNRNVRRASPWSEIYAEIRSEHAQVFLFLKQHYVNILPKDKSFKMISMGHRRYLFHSHSAPRIPVPALRNVGRSPTRSTPPIRFFSQLGLDTTSRGHICQVPADPTVTPHQLCPTSLSLLCRSTLPETTVSLLFCVVSSNWPPSVTSSPWQQQKNTV